MAKLSYNKDHRGTVLTNSTRLETVLKLNIPNKFHYGHDEMISPLVGKRTRPGRNETARSCVCDSRQSGWTAGKPATLRVTAHIERLRSAHTHFHLMDLNISNLSRHSPLTFLSSLCSLLSRETGEKKGKGPERALRSPPAALIWIDMILRFN